MRHTLFEYQNASYQTLGVSSQHPFVEALEALNTQHGNELIQVKRHGIQATQYVGLIQGRHGSLNILPKVDRDVGGEQAATRNLITMLCYAYDLPLVAQSDASLKTGQGSWFEILTGLFARQLYDQLRQGIERVYVTVEERSLALKGRWLLEQQLTRHPYIRHAFDVRYDDYQSDTPLNRVFRYSVELLSTISRAPQNQRLLAEIQMLLDAVSLPHRLTREDLDRVFQPSFQIARLLIESMTQVMQSGAAPLTAFVFDMNVLFESFVARFLAKHWREIAGKAHKGFYVQAQMQGEKTLYLAEREDNVPAFKLIPDLLLRDSLKQVSVVMDTKYKRLDPSTRKLEISQADIYQMLAYANRLGCPRVLLLYPSNQGQVIESQFKILNSEITVDIRTINMHQPLHDTRTLIADLHRIFAPYLL
jgi:5-methylcytosine-specific restriction enzyme subunit McrC